MQKVIFILTLCIVSIVASNAQNKWIKGKVVDNLTKESIIGATITLVNNSQLAITNENGEFYIEITDEINTPEVKIEYLGFDTKLQIMTFNEEFTILLYESSNVLNEVIVTSSYGTTKRREDVVGSMQVLKSDDLQTNQAVESIDKMLDGLATGVLISGGSEIGGKVKIDIRGQGSLTPLSGALVGSSTQPLIIIDGVVMSEENGFDDEIFNGDGSLSESFKNPLARISPEDIESISILKDAAAVGLYGADAANGVILIKTKRSNSSTSKLSFSSQIGISAAINKIKYLNGPQFFELKKEIRKNFGDSELLATQNAGSSTTNTDWYNLLNRNGMFHKYNLNYSKNIKKWNLLTSLNLIKNQEPQVSNSFYRLAGRINLGYVTNKLSSQLNISPSYLNQNTPNNLFSFALPPNISAYNENGSYSELGYNGFGNPLAVAYKNKNNTVSKGIFVSNNTSYQINQYLKISSIAGLDLGDKVQERFLSGQNESGRFNGTFIYENATYPRWGRNLDYFRNSVKWNQSTQIHYERKFSNHSIDLLVGLEVQKERNEAERYLGTGYINAEVDDRPDKAIGSFTKNSILSESARRSIISQVNYDYDKIYYLSLNVRRDESSSFGGDVDPAINGGLGLSCNLHRLSLFENIRNLDLLKLRVSYGVTGNSRIGPYRSLGLYRTSIQSSNGYNGQPYSTPITPPNPYLSWERNYKSNIGIDIHISKRYKLAIEYFNDNITDQIVSREVPVETGFTSIQINGATMYNRGLELSIQAEIINTKNLQLKSSFNISTLRNKITDLKGLGSKFSASETARAQKIGSSTSAIWGIKSAGIDPATGRELYLVGKEVYDGATYRTLFNEKDWEIIGNTQPKLYGGWQNNIVYRKLNFSIRSSFRIGESQLIEDDLVSKYSQIENRNLSINALDRWRKSGDLAANPVASPFHPLIANSSRFLYDASHFKIQNINLSYPFELKGKKLSSFVDISNVYYFYKSKSSRGQNGIKELRNNYPEARTYTWGIQIAI